MVAPRLIFASGHEKIRVCGQLAPGWRSSFLQARGHGKAAEGWLITADQLGAMSPYLRAHISRFGTWATDDLARQPEAFNPVFAEVDFTADLSAAA